MVLKRTTHTTTRSFLRALSELFIRDPQMVTQSTQTDHQAIDPTACDILHCCGSGTVEAYHQDGPLCFGETICGVTGTHQ